jgi:hypothetical protein
MASNNRMPSDSKKAARSSLCLLLPVMRSVMLKGARMNTEHGNIQGDVEITSELKMHGMFTGNVTVKDGGYLILHGMATKSLIVESGAVVEVSGMISGDVINNGGKLSITGSISGQIIEQAGVTNIAENAPIG